MMVKSRLDNFTSKAKSVLVTLALFSFSLQAFGLPVIAQNVVISEVMPNPVVVSDTDGEWIELRNLSNEQQDISGWQLIVDGDAINIPEGSVIATQGYFVICRQTTSAGVPCNMSATFSLVNTGQRTITLMDGPAIIDSASFEADATSPQEIDEVTYNGSTPGNSVTFGKDDLGNDISSTDNANVYNSSNGDEDHGTPGEVNIDDVNPVVAILDPSGPTVENSFSVSGYAFDGESGLKSAELFIDDKSIGQTQLEGYEDNFTFPNISLVKSGTYKIKILVTDHKGNDNAEDADYRMVTVSNDTTVSIKSDRVSDTSPSLSGEVSDKSSKVMVTVNGIDYAAINNGDGSWTLPDDEITPLQDGKYSIRAQATDSIENSIESTAAELIIDTTGPVIRVDEQKTSSRSPKITGTIKDASDIQLIQVRIANGQWKEATYHGTDTDTWSISGYELADKGTTGKVDIEVRAWDSLGNLAYDVTEDELEIISIVHDLADKVSAAFVGVVSAASTAGDGSQLDSDGDGIPDSEDETPYGETEKDDDSKDQDKNSDVASNGDSANNNWRWFLFALAVGAFLWFMFRGRQSEET